VLNGRSPRGRGGGGEKKKGTRRTKGNEAVKRKTNGGAKETLEKNVEVKVMSYYDKGKNKKRKRREGKASGVKKTVNREQG